MKQCAKCPWRKSTDPHEIPNGYCEEKHLDLSKTIAEPALMQLGTLRLMACHDSPMGSERVCVGWLAQQLGPGNNIALRMAAFQGRFGDLSTMELVGDQHERLEDTLPHFNVQRRD